MTQFVYVTCPVTYDLSKLSFIEKIAEILRENEYEPIIPDTDLSAQELFIRDMDLLKKSSFIVSEYSMPSHGVGVETGVSYFKKIPVIGLYEKGKNVSRIIRGAPNIRLIEYDSEGDAFHKFRLELTKLEISNFIIKIIKDAGEIALTNIGMDNKIDYKSSGIYRKYPQPVSTMDVEIENYIVKLISQNYPEHNIMGEESGIIDQGSDYTWIIDSIDGSIQYIRSLPYFSTSIALAYQDNVIFGAIYNPLLSELFYAEKNMGAFFNGSRIKGSQISTLDHAIISSSAYGSYEVANKEKIFQKLLSSIKNIRIFGTPALDLCYVASGRLDARIISYTEPWDHSAGCLIVEEAGGKVTDWEGNPWSIQSKSLLATNQILHKEILKILHNNIE